MQSYFIRLRRWFACIRCILLGVKQNTPACFAGSIKCLSHYFNVITLISINFDRMIINRTASKLLIAGLFAIAAFLPAFTLRAQGPIPRYIEVDFEGHKVAVKLPHLIGKQSTSSPCTYLLTDGTVEYGESNSGHEFRLEGRIFVRISCRKPGRLYYEKFEGAADYLLQPFMPRVAVEARPIPYRIDYYNSDYTALKSIFDLRADNPYTQAKMPGIDIEQYYDAEAGLGSPAPGDETAWLQTYAGSFFFDYGYTGITYRLFRYNARRALLGITTTISIVDTSGQLMYKMSDLDMDIVPVLITQDGNYLATQLNTMRDIQNYPQRLGNPGIRIMDMRTGEVVFEDFVKSVFDDMGYPGQYRDGLIRYRIKEARLGDAFDGVQVILDMRERIKYERLFSREEWTIVTQNFRMLAQKPRGLLDVYDFTLSKF